MNDLLADDRNWPMLNEELATAGVKLILIIYVKTK
jgi:energy-converting hydrogenase Eha subunit E